MSEHRFAVCIRNDGYPVSLELHRLYRMLPDDEAAAYGMVRIEDESGEASHPRELFDPVIPRPMPNLAAFPGDREFGFVVRVADGDDDRDVAYGRLYPRLPDRSAERSGWIRIIDDSGEDYLYPQRLFQVVDVPDALKDELVRTT